MSNNLNLPQMAQNQAAPEVTNNDGNAAIDAALTEILSVDLSGGNVTVSAAQYRGNMRFIGTGVTVARNLTLQAIKRTVVVEADPANTAVVTLVLGTTNIALAPGEVAIVTTDGTANGLKATKGNAFAEFGVFLPGLMQNAQICFRYKTVNPFKLPTDLVGSYLNANAAATGSTVFTFKKNGASIGTATVAGAASDATFSITATSFAQGDLLSIHGPATADATLADIAIDLKGTR